MKTCQRWGLTYHPHIFEEIKRKLKQFDVEIVASNYENLRNLLTNVKDKTPLEQTKGVIYKLCCKDCSAVYVGESGQRATTRLYRHNLAERNFDSSHYPLVEHCINECHAINWEKIEVLATEANKTKRKLMESLFIKYHKSSVNKYEGVVHSDIFNYILTNVKFPRPKGAISFKVV